MMIHIRNIVIKIFLDLRSWKLKIKISKVLNERKLSGNHDYTNIFGCRKQSSRTLKNEGLSLSKTLMFNKEIHRLHRY